MADHLLIFTAVQQEARAIHKHLGAWHLPIRAIGIGATHLPLAADLKNVSTILLCGLAGGLDPALRIGDVVVDDTTCRLLGMPLPRSGIIQTATRIVSTPAQKAELFQQTGALAVDMEQSIVREFAKIHHINVIGIRSISDTADQVLDPAVAHLVDEMGRPRPIQIAGHLLRRPSLIPYLRTLSKNTKIALESLAKAVKSIAEQLEGN